MIKLKEMLAEGPRYNNKFMFGLAHMIKNAKKDPTVFELSKPLASQLSGITPDDVFYMCGRMKSPGATRKDILSGTLEKQISVSMGSSAAAPYLKKIKILIDFMKEVEKYSHGDTNVYSKWA